MIVYCSIPAITRRDSTLSEIQDKICLSHVTMNYMRPHDNYMVDRVRQSNCLIVMHQHNMFDFTLDSLTDTVKKDIEEARKCGKRIFLAYRTSNGQLCIYDTIIYKDSYIKGVPGSSRAIGDYLKNNDVDKIILGNVPDNSEQRQYHEMYGNTQAQRETEAQKKFIAQIGKQPDIKDLADSMLHGIIEETLNKPTPQKIEQTKSVGIVKPMHDRRLLI